LSIIALCCARFGEIFSTAKNWIQKKLLFSGAKLYIKLHEYMYRLYEWQEILTARLEDLATVQVGYTFRERPEPDPNGGVLLVQMKDVSELGCLDTEGLVRLEFGEIRESHRLLAGDIVFRSRGTNVTCALVPELPLPALLAAPLFRIRVTSASVSPPYLVWFINQLGRSHLDAHSQGSDLKMVSIQSLKDLEVVVPDTDIQAATVEIAELARQERHLLGDIVERRSKLVSSCLARAIQEN
jgi:hypothetical protein